MLAVIPVLKMKIHSVQQFSFRQQIKVDKYVGVINFSWQFIPKLAVANAIVF